MKRFLALIILCAAGSVDAQTVPAFPADVILPPSIKTTSEFLPIWNSPPLDQFTEIRVIRQVKSRAAVISRWLKLPSKDVPKSNSPARTVWAEFNPALGDMTKQTIEAIEVFSGAKIVHELPSREWALYTRNRASQLQNANSFKRDSSDEIAENTLERGNLIITLLPSTADSKIGVRLINTTGSTIHIPNKRSPLIPIFFEGIGGNPTHILQFSFRAVGSERSSEISDLRVGESNQWVFDLKQHFTTEQLEQLLQCRAIRPVFVTPVLNDRNVTIPAQFLVGDFLKTHPIHDR